jgi:flagellin
MGISLSANTAAFTAGRHLSVTSGSMLTSLARLSSGYRINRAADDASGLQISEGLRAQIRAMTQAVRNGQDGISVVQTAEGALGETASILRHMRDLSVQAANKGALNGEAIGMIQTEIGHLQTELTQLAHSASWNDTRLLDGSYSGTFQVGANAGETVQVTIGARGHAMDAAGLGVASIDVTRATGGLAATGTAAVSAAQGAPASGRVDLAGDFTTAGTYQNSFAGLTGTITYNGKTFDLGSVDYTGAVTATDYLDKLNFAARPVLGTSTYPFTGSATALMFTGDVPGAGSTTADAAALTPTYTGTTGAGDAIAAIDRAISTVSAARVDLGAVQNRFEHTVERLQMSIENTTSSESRIRDTDMAQEMSTYSRDQILTQAGSAMLSQATHSADVLLKLLN